MNKIIFVDCAVPSDEAIKNQNKAIQEGYLLTGQYDWEMVYEHPDYGDREDIMKRHREYMSYLISVGICI